MKTLKPVRWLVTMIFLPAIVLVTAPLACGQDLIELALQQTPPPVDIATGSEIPSKGYCDQPYVVKLPTGEWLCTMTTGKGKEGQAGQHIVSSRSSDQGKTWTPWVDIEPADGPPAS